MRSMRRWRRVDMRNRQQLSASLCLMSYDVSLLRTPCGHCANIALRGVMNVSAGELQSPEVSKVNLSLAVSGLSMHTI